MTYPDDCVQSIVAEGKWWEPQTESRPVRGSLIHCFIPHTDQVPYGFEPVGRKDPTQHTTAEVKVAPLKVDQPLKQAELPVAAMPLHGNEVWAAYRAKRRPCLVLSVDHPEVDKGLTRGKPNNATASMVLVAPFFGVDPTPDRAGYHPEFVQRVMHGMYPQFLVDWLPLTSTTQQSILRLDQLQAIGAHSNSFKLCGHKLSAASMKLVDGWLEWLITGELPGDHVVTDAVELLQALEN